MSDPRVAALAEALDRTDKSGHPGRAEQAAAILAALDGWTLVPTDTSLAYDTGFQDGLGEAGQIHADAEAAYKAEIARLRRIEETAREYRQNQSIAARDELDAALARGSGTGVPCLHRDLAGNPAHVSGCAALAGGSE